MADILISHCNHLYFDRKQVRKMQPYPNLQAILAAACLRQAGFSVTYFDSTFTDPMPGFATALEESGARLVFLCEDNFNYLTKMCLTRNRELAFAMAGLAGTAGVAVAAGGSDAADRPAEYLENGVDFVVSGEVEDTIVELAGCLLGDRTRKVSQVAGLSWRNPSSGRLHLNPRRAAMEDIDRLPLPAWDLIDLESFRGAWNSAHGCFSLNLAASRGCPYRCNWCAKPIHGTAYRTHSPARVAAEMALLKQTARPQHLWFADDIFALAPAWTLAFADEVEARNALVPFKMQSRCDLMTRPAVAALRRAGCGEVWMGAESGSQAVLDAMDKGIRVQDTYRACENLRAHGIRVGLFLQFGYPGETWEDISRTIRMVRDTRPDDIGVSVAYPLPGTRFHELVKPQLGAKRNWEDSDDLTMMFQGTYTSDFYRALRDALHMEIAGDPGHHEAWRRVEEMEKTSAAERPTLLWTCS